MIIRHNFCVFVTQTYLVFTHWICLAERMQMSEHNMGFNTPVGYSSHISINCLQSAGFLMETFSEYYS